MEIHLGFQHSYLVPPPTSVLPSFFDNVPCSLAKADLSSSRLPSKLTSTSRLANQCSQLKTGGYIFLTSAPHKTSHGSSLLVSPIPLLNEICSSQHYSTFTCPMLLSRDQKRRKDRLLGVDKSQLSLTSLPFSSAPSEEGKPKSTWGKLKQMAKDYW